MFAVRHEFAQTAIDVLARRTRLAFLDTTAARTAAPRVIELMAEELGWSKKQKAQELANVHAFLDTMTVPAPDLPAKK